MKQAAFFYTALLLAVVSFPSARTWPVPSSECPTIQAGIDSASVSDTVTYADEQTQVVGMLSGAVIAVVDSSPLPGVPIRQRRSHLHTTTDTNGMFLIKRILPGKYRLTALSSCCSAKVFEDVIIDPGEVAHIELAIEEPYYIELKGIRGTPSPDEHHGEVIGRVVDDETGEPLAMTGIVIVELHLGVYSDRCGCFEIDGVPPGTYRVKAMCPTFYIQELDSVAVYARDETEIEFRLRRNLRYYLEDQDRDIMPR